jgi:hypothetical protein
MLPRIKRLGYNCVQFMAIMEVRACVLLLLLLHAGVRGAHRRPRVLGGGLRTHPAPRAAPRSTHTTRPLGTT